MARKKKEPKVIRVELMQADVPTRSGYIYPRELLEKLATSINEGRTPVAIEEVSPLERKAKGIPVCSSWKEHAMALAVDASLDERGYLQVDFALKGNKYGKLLETTLASGKKYEFFPVGTGDTNSKNEVTSYSMQYVSFNEI